MIYFRHEKNNILLVIIIILLVIGLGCFFLNKSEEENVVDSSQKVNTNINGQQKIYQSKISNLSFSYSDNMIVFPVVTGGDDETLGVAKSTTDPAQESVVLLSDAKASLLGIRSNNTLTSETYGDNKFEVYHDYEYDRILYVLTKGEQAVLIISSGDILPDYIDLSTISF